MWGFLLDLTHKNVFFFWIQQYYIIFWTILKPVKHIWQFNAQYKFGFLSSPSAPPSCSRIDRALYMAGGGAEWDWHCQSNAADAPCHESRARRSRRHTLKHAETHDIRLQHNHMLTDSHRRRSHYKLFTLHAESIRTRSHEKKCPLETHTHAQGSKVSLWCVNMGTYGQL